VTGGTTFVGASSTGTINCREFASSDSFRPASASAALRKSSDTSVGDARSAGFVVGEVAGGAMRGGFTSCAWSDDTADVIRIIRAKQRFRMS
jgi:hypothetical protein